VPPSLDIPTILGTTPTTHYPYPLPPTPTPTLPPLHCTYLHTHTPPHHTTTPTYHHHTTHPHHHIFTGHSLLAFVVVGTGACSHRSTGEHVTLLRRRHFAVARHRMGDHAPRAWRDLPATCLADQRLALAHLPRARRTRAYRSAVSVTRFAAGNTLARFGTVADGSSACASFTNASSAAHCDAIAFCMPRWAAALLAPAHPALLLDATRLSVARTLPPQDAYLRGLFTTTRSHKLWATFTGKLTPAYYTAFRATDIYLTIVSLRAYHAAARYTECFHMRYKLVDLPTGQPRTFVSMDAPAFTATVFG